MAYELAFFENFILSVLPACAIPDPKYIKDYPRKVNALRAEVVAIETNINRTIFSKLQDKAEISHYVRHQQTAITILADKLVNYLDERQAARVTALSPAHSMTNLVKVCYLCLEKLLDFIDFYFGSYLSPDVPLPVLYLLRNTRDMEKKRFLVEKELRQANADTDLLFLAFEPLAEFLEQPRRCIEGLRLVNYYKQLFKYLDRLPLARIPQDRLSSRLLDILYNYNHNSHSFFIYCRELSQAKIDAAETLREKQVVIRTLIKDLTRAPHVLCSALRGNRASLRELSLEWLQGELEVCQEELLLREKPLSEEEAADGQGHLFSDFTTEVMAHFAYLQYKLKMLHTGETGTPEHPGRLFRFYCSNVLQKNGQPVNFKYFKKCWYEPSRRVIDTTRQFLRDMLRFSGERFG